MHGLKADRPVLIGLAVVGLAACEWVGINLNVETNDSSCQGDLDPANGFVKSVGGIGTENCLAGETVARRVTRTNRPSTRST